MKYIDLEGATTEIEESNQFIIKGNIFDDSPNKKLQVIRVTSKNINEFNIDQIGEFKDGTTIQLFENGNYILTSSKEFKKKGKRIFVTALSPPKFTFENYKEVLLMKDWVKCFYKYFSCGYPSSIIPLVICSFFAYALTWMQFFGRDTLR